MEEQKPPEYWKVTHIILIVPVLTIQLLQLLLNAYLTLWKLWGKKYRTAKKTLRLWLTWNSTSGIHLATAEDFRGPSQEGSSYGRGNGELEWPPLSWHWMRAYVTLPTSSIKPSSSGPGPRTASPWPRCCWTSSNTQLNSTRSDSSQMRKNFARTNSLTPSPSEMSINAFLKCIFLSLWWVYSCKTLTLKKEPQRHLLFDSEPS